MFSPIFQDIKEAHIIPDDLVIATESKERHEEVLHECLRWIRDRGMTLNLKNATYPNGNTVLGYNYQ